MKINHQLLENEYFIPNWNINHLFLGTFNPEGGEKVRYYYGRKKNQTWPILAKIFSDNRLLLESSDVEFFTSLKDNGIACLDLIKYVECNEMERDFIIGKGYSDSKIINKKVKREYMIDEIIKIIKANEKCVVYSTWGKGSNLKDWLKQVEKISQEKTIIRLVSPSLIAKVPKGENKVEFIERQWKSKINSNY